VEVVPAVLVARLSVVVEETMALPARAEDRHRSREVSASLESKVQQVAEVVRALMATPSLQLVRLEQVSVVVDLGMALVRHISHLNSLEGMALDVALRPEFITMHRRTRRRTGTRVHTATRDPGLVVRTHRTLFAMVALVAVVAVVCSAQAGMVERTRPGTSLESLVVRPAQSDLDMDQVVVVAEVGITNLTPVAQVAQVQPELLARCGSSGKP
jgi:hypothetical protein